MNYCSLEDAFQAIGGAPTPGCDGPSATKQARKEERRKAKRCKGPPLAFFDPDRPMQATVEPLTTSSSAHWSDTSGTNSTPHWSQPPTDLSTQEEFHHKKHLPDQDSPNFDKDPLYEYVQHEVNDHVMHVAGSTKEAYFGADPEEDAVREPFEAAFEPVRVSSPMAVMPATSAMPFPNMYWKSKTPAQSAFIEHLPPMPIASNRVRRNSTSHDEMTMMKRKMDHLFAQLEDMKGGGASPEQMTSEIMMFVSSGIVILFLMDLMVKKSSA